MAIVLMSIIKDIRILYQSYFRKPLTHYLLDAHSTSSFFPLFYPGVPFPGFHFCSTDRSRWSNKSKVKLAGASIWLGALCYGRNGVYVN